MKDYKRLTAVKVNGTTERYLRIDKNYISSAYDIITEEKYEFVDMILSRLAELEDKIENGTLVFKKEIPTKYYALVLHRDCYGKNSWHIHHAPIEYEKENNRVAIQVNGLLYVTTKNMLFKTKAEAKAKLCELQFLEVAEHNIAIFEKKLRELEEKENV